MISTPPTAISTQARRLTPASSRRVAGLTGDLRHPRSTEAAAIVEAKYRSTIVGDPPTLPTARVVIAIVAVGWRLLTVPFCRGFAGIEALNAFLAVKSQYFLFNGKR